MGNISGQKSIAKNTVFLYFRMIVVMGVSLYTSRVVLDKLGIDDYGIYSIVGSVVVSLTFLSNALTSAMRRFFCYEIGEKGGNCSNIFTINIKIQLIIIAILFLLLETIGLWFFENVIKIPVERESAASIVYQFSIVTFCFNLLQAPYSSLIVARERMSVFAIFSILDVVLQLLIVFLLSLSLGIDNLVLYGFLMMIVSFIVLCTYYFYCRSTMKEDCRVTGYWNKKQFYEIFSFASWNVVGGLTTVGTNEVPNYFMNYYLGVVVNAAMGIAGQVSRAVYSFSSNFQMAFNPQIVKSYASGESDNLLALIYRTSKLSFFLMYVLALPLMLCCNEVLNVWLTVVPEYTVYFCLFIMLSELVQALSSPLWMTIFAVGNIKKYQLWLSGFNLTVIPVSWLVLAMGFQPYWILAYKVVISVIILIYRVEYLRLKIDFQAVYYYKQVVVRLLVIVPILTVPLLYWVSTLFIGWNKILVTSSISAIVVCLVFYLIGLNKNERNFIQSYLLRKLSLSKNG